VLLTVIELEVGTDVQRLTQIVGIGRIRLKADIYDF
jgi:hypothetical protein